MVVAARPPFRAQARPALAVAISPPVGHAEPRREPDGQKDETDVEEGHPVLLHSPSRCTCTKAGWYSTVT